MRSTSSGQGESDLSARLARVESVLSEQGIANDGMDLRALFRALWRGKWLILAVVVASGMVSVALALKLPNQYKATAVLIPASTSGSSSLSRLAGQFGGLASLAGVNLGGQDQGSKTTVAIELIKSWGFQEQFIRDNHLEVAIFAAKGWNKQDDRLVIDPAIYDVQNQRWVGKLNPSPGQVVAGPGGWELHQKFSRLVSIVQDKKTNLITLSVEFYSPTLAKEWVDKLVATVNKHLQDQDQIEAEKGIKYLEDKMTQTNVLEIRTALSRLVEEQTKNLMLTRVSDEYVLKTLSAAKIPEEKSGPKRSSFCIMVVLVSSLLAAIGWLLWLMYRRELNAPAVAERHRPA